MKQIIKELYIYIVLKIQKKTKLGFSCLLFMCRMRHNSGRQSVKADHICYNVGILDNKTVNDVVSWQKPISKFFLGVNRNHFVVAQILKMKY